MPVWILRPAAPGDFSEWPILGGSATAWEAVRAAGGGWLNGTNIGQRVRVGFEPLPAGAATVTRVTQFAMLAGDDAVHVTQVIRLAGTDLAASGSELPPNGGFAEFSRTFALAPDGGGWTVAKVNALQGGLDIPDTGLPLADQLWLSVEGEEAVAEAPADPQTYLELGPSAPTGLDLGPSRARLALASGDPVALDLGSSKVALPLAPSAPTTLEMGG